MPPCPHAPDPPNPPDALDALDTPTSLYRRGALMGRDI